MKFKNISDYKIWIHNEEWYQSMVLPSKIKIKGKFNTLKRIPLLEEYNYNNKNILDIGCNSGQYCFFTKEKKAKNVFGIDLNKKRISQAKILALNEDLDINFINTDITTFSIPENIKFDYIFCFAVITEISDIFSVLYFLKNNIHDLALIELKLSNPILYIPNNLRSLKYLLMKKIFTAEIYQHRHAGWVFHPSLDFLKNFFGKNFKIKYINKGFRYDFISIQKI